MKPYKKLVDSYAHYSNKIAELEKIKKQIRQELLEVRGEKPMLTGKEFSVVFNETSRNTIDRKSLEQTFGVDVVAKHLKQTNVMTIKVTANR